jgi:hypothetical protein
MTNLKLYKELDPNNFYLLGVDTAKSLVGDFATIEIFDYVSFEQIGEFYARLGSITKFTEIVKAVIKFVYSKVGTRLLAGIENNSIGAAVVESLLNDEDFDYAPFIYETETKTKTKNGFVEVKSQYGIVTSTRTKDQMISLLYEVFNNNPSNIHSSDLISQLSVIEKKINGAISASSGHHDDLFMASCFCAYIRKNAAMDIEPLIDINPAQFQLKQDNLVTNLMSINNTPNVKQIKSYYGDVEHTIFHSNKEEEDEDEIDYSDLPLIF